VAIPNFQVGLRTIAAKAKKEWRACVLPQRRSNGRGTVRPSVATVNGPVLIMRCHESIAHRARRALVKKNAERGKDTKLHPKARQYWSDLDLESSESEDEENNGC
jgi:hypothetical protein